MHILCAPESEVSDFGLSGAFLIKDFRSLQDFGNLEAALQRVDGCACARPGRPSDPRVLEELGDRVRPGFRSLQDFGILVAALQGVDRCASAPGLAAHLSWIMDGAGKWILRHQLESGRVWVPANLLSDVSRIRTYAPEQR